MIFSEVNELVDKKTGTYIWRVLFALLLAVMSFYLMYTVTYSDVIAVVVTILTSFIAGFFVFPSIRDYCLDYYREHPGQALLIFTWSEYLMYKLCRNNSGAAKLHSMLPDQVFVTLGYLLGGVALTLVFMTMVRCFGEILVELWNCLPKHVKTEYIIFSSIMSASVFLCFQFKPGWVTYNDMIYSADTQAVFSVYFSNPDICDVRHPLLGVVIYPIMILLQATNRIFVSEMHASMFLATGLQLVFIQVILWTGLMLYQLTKHEMIFHLYCCGNASMIYYMLLEKFQLCVFLLVLYVYLRVQRKTGSDKVYALAGGMMLTSYVVGLTELFDSSIPLLRRIYNSLRVLLCTLVVTIVSGRIHLLIHGWSDALMCMGGFKTKTSLGENVRAVLWMLQSMFAPLDVINDGVFFRWRDVTTGWSVCGIIIMILAILGFIRKRKDYFTQVAMVWFAFAWILIVAFQWDVIEAPLFNIVFYWAVLPLFISATDWIIERLKLNKYIVYGVFGMILAYSGALDVVSIHLAL